MKRLTQTLQFSIPFIISYLVSYSVYIPQKTAGEYTFNILSVSLLSANLIGLCQVASLRPKAVVRERDGDGSTQQNHDKGGKETGKRMTTQKESSGEFSNTGKLRVSSDPETLKAASLAKTADKKQMEAIQEMASVRDLGNHGVNKV
jgi:hypothetical protein